VQVSSQSFRVPSHSTAESAAHQIARNCGWLSEAPLLFQDVLLARCQVLEFNAGAVLWDLGDAPDAMYGLTAGQTANSVQLQNGSQFITHLHQPGDWFGEISPLLRAPRRSRLTTTRPSQLIVLTLRDIDHLLAARDPELDPWRQFARLLVGESNLVTQAAMDLMIRDPRARCAAVVLRLSGIQRGGRSLDLQPEIDISQEELAAMCNLSRNAVGTILRNLAKAGVLEPRYKCIKLLDGAALQRAAHGEPG
jgi:CRP-like cAMP-binding protein